MKIIGTFKDYTDSSVKTVFDKESKNIIEMTLLNNKENMDVVCAPTHNYCNLGCKMCHLTNDKISRPMSQIEVDDFLKCLCVTLMSNGKRRTNKDKLLISFMGVGDPLMNLKLIEDVHENEKIIKRILGYKDISYALATMMPNKKMTKLMEIVNEKNIPLKVHYSMHTPIDLNRKKLIPSTFVTNKEALSYLARYRELVQSNNEIMKVYTSFHRTNDPVEIHYTLIKYVNDSIEDLCALTNLLKEYNIPIKFIRFNPKEDLEISDKENAWIKYLIEKIPGLRVKRYAPPGKEIGASCGEFTKHFYQEENETREEKEEYERWREEHQIFEEQTLYRTLSL